MAMEDVDLLNLTAIRKTNEIDAEVVCSIVTVGGDLAYEKMLYMAALSLDQSSSPQY